MAPRPDGTKKRWIPVAEPVLNGNERKYVLECIDSTWISSAGKFVNAFEESFAQACGVDHAVACSSGTAALHLALLALDVGPEDEVIVPTLTYVASANAVTYCGATPVFIDSEPGSWNMDPVQLEALITPKTRCVIVVHLYGHPVDMDAIREVCDRHGVAIVEDAAEALGASCRGVDAGGLGDIAAFSFYGNKVITTGEGGMVVTRDAATAAKVRQLHGQGVDPERRYWFPVVGYNYRMTNVAAAIGLAQLEQLDWHLERRRDNRRRYGEALASLPHVTLQGEQPWARSCHWMISVVLDGVDAAERDAVMERMLAAGVETRPVFHPMHTLPMYRAGTVGREFPVADDLATRGFSLPSSATLTEGDVEHVVRTLETATG